MGYGLGAAIGAKMGLPGQNRGKYSRRRLFPYEHERDRHSSSLR